MEQIGTSEFTPVKIVAKDEENRLLDLERAIKTLARLTCGALEDSLEVPEAHLTLSAMETRAFLQSHDKENSFRAGYNSALRHAVTTYARLRSETECCRRLQETTYLWQEHAAALQYLTGHAKEVTQGARQAQDLAVKRGLSKHVIEMDSACERLAHAVAEAEIVLAEQMSAPADATIAFLYMAEERFVEYGLN
jgi:hypothetical protein